MFDFQISIPKQHRDTLKSFFIEKGWWFQGPQPRGIAVGFVISGKEHYELLKKHFTFDIVAKIVCTEDDGIILRDHQQQYLENHNIRMAGLKSIFKFSVKAGDRDRTRDVLTRKGLWFRGPKYEGDYAGFAISGKENMVMLKKELGKIILTTDEEHEQIPLIEESSEQLVSVPPSEVSSIRN
jgi:hypothetical protein